MRCRSYSLMAIPLWLGAWMLLAGADGSCFGSGQDCAELTEEECLANSECRPLYETTWRNYDVACGEAGTRCIDAPEMFVGCEEKPVCSELDEQACVAEPACQAVYGYGDYIPMAGEREAAPLCWDENGTGCLDPYMFLECLDAGADPCAGLGEADCLRRPICEADYGYNEDDCYCPGEYQGCHLVNAQCRTVEDCYMFLPADPSIIADPGCLNSWYSCDNGQCNLHCEPGCSSDADCPAGQHCEFTGLADKESGAPFWAGGICVPNPNECASDADCPAGEHCELMPCDCAEGDCLCASYGFCVPNQNGCQSDIDCPAGQVCQVNCWEGWCEGVCVEIPVECTADADCPAGFRCELQLCDCADPTGEECYCPPMGWCVPNNECVTDEDCYLIVDDIACQNYFFTCENGQCVYHCNMGCQSDADCAAGEICQQNCWDGWCEGICVPVQKECFSDLDCPAGERCELPLCLCDGGTDEMPCYCPGVCVPDTIGCQSDSECAPGEICQLECDETGVCRGVCVWPGYECTTDFDCGQGKYCEQGFCLPGVWTQFTPLQCESTPWEQDMEANPDLYWECMWDCGGEVDCMGGYVTICQVTVFLRNQGIIAHDVRDVNQGETCSACGCARGDVVYVLTAPFDFELMLALGFMPF